MFRVVCATGPNEREKSQMYAQRYIPSPAGRRRDRDLRSQLVQPRRGRACDGLLHGGRSEGVPPGHAARGENRSRLRHLDLKYWLEVSPEEQTEAFAGPYQRSPQGLETLSDGFEVLWPLVRLFARARRDVRGHRHDFAPWYVARSDDTKLARLNIITHLLSKIPYERTKPEKIKLPKRQRRGGYREPEHPLRYVQERF